MILNGSDDPGTYLFIGGPKDGEYIHVIAGETVVFSAMAQPVDYPQVDFIRVVYRKQCLMNEKHDPVYVFVASVVDDVIQALLRGYRKP